MVILYGLLVHPIQCHVTISTNTKDDLVCSVVYFDQGFQFKITSSTGAKHVSEEKEVISNTYFDIQ